MVRVKWDEVQHIYDDMISVLLSTLNPTSERLDGSGGDGGRDVQIREGGCLEIFQLKSFVGRISPRSPNRRVQVERSLEEAAKWKPDAWYLVVPIDHNDSELKWFDGLKEKYNFPLIWLGKTWLDKKMGENPSIPRYFESGDTAAIRTLMALQQEQALLAGGIPDALDRLNRLKAQLDEISPFYGIDISLAKESTSVTIRPKYRGAERDRPILISGTFAFQPADSDLREKLIEVLDYGGSIRIPKANFRDVKVDAPAGLEATHPEADVYLSSTDDGTGLPVTFVLSITDSNQKVLTQLPGSFTDRTAGRKGLILSGKDTSGCLAVRCRVDLSEHTMKLDLSTTWPEAVLPGTVIPVRRFASMISPPNFLTLKIGNTEPIGPMPTPEISFVSKEWEDIISDLAFIQERRAVFFAAPKDISRSEALAIRHTRRLLSGETVERRSGRVTVTMTPHDLRAYDQILQSPEGFAFLARQDMSLIIGDNTVPIGTLQTYSPAVTLDNLAQVQALRDSGHLGEVELQLTAHAGAPFTDNLI